MSVTATAAAAGASACRIGQIVPRSNTTMETEIPAMLRAREAVLPERFTFYSSRMRRKKVVKEELEAMDRDSDRCALEPSDARVDVPGYACLVATMSMGRGHHRARKERLHARTVENGAPAPVVTSAGALVEGLPRGSRARRRRAAQRPIPRRGASTCADPRSPGRPPRP